MEKEKIKKLNREMEGSIAFGALQDKAEFGTNMSEKANVLSAPNTAWSYAKELNLNSELAELYTRFLVSFFPAEGREGLACIEEYFKRKGVPFSKADLAKLFYIKEFDLFSGVELPEEVLKEFDMLFSQADSGNGEIELAKLVHAIYDKLKIIERKASQKPSASAYKQIIQDTTHYDSIQESNEAGNEIDRTLVEKVKEYGGIYGYRKAIEGENDKDFEAYPHMTHEQKEAYINSLDEAMRAKNAKRAVFEFLATGPETPSNQMEK